MNFELEFRSSYLSGGHDVQPGQTEPDLPDELQPHYHQVDTLLLAWHARVSYGIGTRVILQTALPIHMNVVDANFTGHDEQPLPEYIDSIHHRDETIVGIGDLQLSALIRAVSPADVDGWSLDLTAGISFPTGRVEENPFELGRRKQRHQHMFFGNGTFIPTLGLHTQLALDGLTLVASVNGRLSLYESAEGYQSSSAAFGSLGVQTGFGLEDWRFGVYQQVNHLTPASWEDERALNSGRTDLMVGLQVGWHPSPLFGINLIMQIPYYGHTTGEQYDIPFMSNLTFSTGFDLVD